VQAVASIAAAQPAPSARPTGGQVVAGQASIAQTQARTTVTQTTDRAAVNWQGFDVGGRHTVQFQQPAASSVTLNRVVGPNPSHIAGKLQANGQVVIVNQAGVVFHQGAQIDTAGLVASAAGISNGNFMAGRMVFDQPANPGARVENHGTITVRDRGLAALVAPHVANSGVVQARMGTVILAGAAAHTLDLYGDGMVSINVTRQVQSAPDGARALVVNSGTIAARDGTVTLTAEAVDGVIQTLVNAGGHIAAGGETGRVTITGRGGNVVVAGKVLANSETKGGAIAINTTGTVALAITAQVDASGKAGGGTVAIGTTLARATGGPGVTGEPTARAVSVAPGAGIRADATDKGNGGVVVLLATETTRMEGLIAARGGPRGGNGGFVEVSGRAVSITRGRIDVGAWAGNRGSILIDPDFLDVIDGILGTGSQDPVVNDGTIVAGDPSVPPDTISNGALNALTGNVLLQANQTIAVKANVSLTNAAGQSLTLQAGGSITVDAGVSVTASGDVVFATGGAGPATAPTAQANPLINVLGSVTSTAGAISLLAGTGGSISVAGSLLASGVTLDAAAGIGLLAGSRVGQAGAAIVLRSANGGVSQDATGILIGASLSAPQGLATNVTLVGAANAIASLGSVTIVDAGQSFTLINTGNLSIDGPLTVPHDVGIASNAASKITINGTIANTTGALAIIAGTGGIALASGARVDASRIGLTAQGPITLASGARMGLAGGFADLRTTAGGVTQDAGALVNLGTILSAGGVTGSVTLIGTANTIGTLGNFAVTGGDFLMGSLGDLAIVGPVSASGLIGIGTASGVASTGTISVSGSLAAGSSLALVSTNGGIALNGGAVVTGTTSQLSAAAPIGLAAGAVLGQAGGTVDLSTSAGGIAQDSAATLIAATLRSGSGITGPVSLIGTANAIGALGAMAISGAGSNLTLNTSTGLAVTGAVSVAGAITLTTGAFSAAHTISAGTTLAVTSGSGGIALNTGAALTAPLVTLSGQTGGLTLAAGAALGQAGGTIDVVLTGGGITQDPGATLTGAHLRSSGVTGTVSLIGTANNLAELGPFVVNGAGAGLNLVDTGGLAVTGALSAPGPIAISTDSANPLAVSAPISASTSLTLTSNSGGITIDPGGVLAAPALLLQTRGPISFGAGAVIGQTGAVLDINTTAGGVMQDPGATLTAGTLVSASGITGDVNLTSVTNAIGTIAAMPVTGNLTLRDQGGLAISGVVAATGTAAITTTGGLSLLGSGSLTAPSITLDLKGALTLSAGAGLGQTGAVIDVSTDAGGINQDPGATILAFNLFSPGTIVGAVTLAGTANVIAGLGPLSVSGGGLSLVNTGPLRLVGPISAADAIAVTTTGGGITVTGSVVAATSAGLSASGTIALAASASLTAPAITVNAGTGIILGAASLLGQSGADLDLVAASGGITQDASATLRAATLRSSAGVTGTVTLAGAANAIDTLGTFSVTGGDFTLLDTGALTVTGPVGAGTSVAITAGTVDVTGSITAGSGALSVTATQGTLTQSGSLVSGGGLTLSAQTGLTHSGTTTAGPAGVAMTASTGDFLNTGTISAAGPIALTSSGSIALGGSINSSGAGALTAITAGAGINLTTGGRVESDTITLHAQGPITLGANTTLGRTGAIIDARTLAGDLTQDTSSVITAASLTSASGIAGAIDLVGSNAIAGLGALTLAGDLQLRSNVGLTVTGSVVAGGDSFLRNSAAAGITIAATGALRTQSGGRAGFRTARLDIAPGGTVTTGEFEFAPLVQGATLGLGATSGGLITLVGVTATQATIGAVTPPGTSLIITAGAIETAGTFDANAIPLRLLSLGGIAGTGGPVINAPSITGSAGGSVALSHAANRIGAVAGFTVTGPDTDFVLTSADPISVSGGITALRDIVLESTAGAISLGAGLTGGRQAILRAGGVIAVGAGIAAPDVTLAAQGAISVGAGVAIGVGGGIVDFSTTAGGLAQATDSVITAAKLQSASGLVGDVVLAGTANAIGTITGLAVTGDFALTNPGDLSVSGPLTATGGIDLTLGATAGLIVSGTIAAGATLALNTGSGGLSLLTGGEARAASVIADVTGPITVASGATLGQAGAVLDLSTTAGGVTVAAGGTILAATLRSGTGIAGDVSLPGPNSAIGTIGAVAVTGGGFSLSNSVDTRVEGALSASGPIGITTSGRLVLAGSLSTPGAITLGAGAGGLAVNAGVIVAGPSITIGSAGGLDFGATSVVGQSGAMLDLSAATGITQDPTARLIGARLLSSGGVGGAATLTGTANAIGTLDVFTVTGGAFSLVDGSALHVLGAVTADSVALTAPSLTLTSTLTAQAGTVTMTANAGAITQNGTVAAITGATLTAATTLAQTGTVGASGAGATVALSAGNATLTQSGSVISGGTVTLAAAASITQSGTIGATDRIALAAGQDLTLSGGMTAGAAGIDLQAGRDISLFSGSNTTTGGIDVGALGNFFQTSGTLAATGPLRVNVGASFVQNSGGVLRATSSTGVIELTASNLTIGGLITATDPTGGRIDVVATGASLGVTGTIAAGSRATLDAVAGGIAQSGTVTAGAGGVTQSAGLGINLTNATLSTSGAISQSAGTTLTQTQSNVSAGGAISQTALGALTQSEGSVVAGGALSLTAASIELTGATQSAGTDIGQTATTTIRLSDTTLSANGAITQKAGADLSLDGGGVTAGGALTQTVGVGLTLTNTTLTGKDAVTQTAGGAIAFDGVTLTATGALDQKAGGVLSLLNSVITGGAIVTQHAGTDLAQTGGGVSAAGTLTQTAGGRLTLADTTLSGDGAVTQTAGADLTLTNTTLTGKDAVTQTAGGAIAFDGVTLTATGALDQKAGGALSLLNSVITGGAIVTQHAGTDLTQTGGGVSAAGTLTQTADGRLTLANTTLSGEGAVTQTAGADLTLTNTTLTGKDAVTQTATDNIAIEGANLKATGALDQKAGGALSLLNTVITGGAAVTQSAAANLTLTGNGVTSIGALTQQAGSDLILNNTTLTSTATLTQTAGSLIGLDGVTLIAAGGLDQNAGGALSLLNTLITGGAGVTQRATTDLTLTGGGISVAGALKQDADGALSLINTKLDASGAITQAAGGGITHSGALVTAGADVTLTALGTIAQDTAATIRAGSVGGKVVVTGEQIAMNGTILALDSILGAITFNASGPTTDALTLGGTVTGGFAVTGSSSVGGTRLNSMITAGLGGVTFNAAGPLTQAGGTLSTAGTLSLSSATTLTQSAGSASASAATNLTAGALIAQDGGMLSGLTIGLTAPRITQGLGASIRAADTGGTVTLNAADAIATSGTILALDSALGVVNLTAGGADGITLGAGVVTGGFAVNGSAPSGQVSTGANVTAGAGGVNFTWASDFTQTGGVIQAPRDIVFTSPGSFHQNAGTIQVVGASGPNVIRILANGTALGAGFTQGPSGAILAQAGGGNVEITAANRIATQGTILAPDLTRGTIALTAQGLGGDATSLAQGARVEAGASITANAARGNIDHSGSAVAPVITLAAASGAVTQSAGLINATASAFTLASPTIVTQLASATIMARGSITVAGVSGVSQGGTLSVPGGSITLTTQSGALETSGAMVAGQVFTTNSVGPIAIGGAINGLTPAQLQSVSQFAVRASEFPATAEGAGLYVTTGPLAGQGGAQQVSVSADLTASNGGRGQMLITIPNNNPLSLTASSPNADLYLSLGTGPASGLVQVGSLHLRYADKGTGSAVEFGGSVNGLSGYTAASAAFILPTMLPNYQLNGCAIQAVTCIQISDLRVPVANPLKEVLIGRSGSGNAIQFALPDVAERDY
jgi:filamentous hemagglutinin family protein